MKKYISASSGRDDEIIIKNVPEYARQYNYIVARSDEDIYGTYWFWGAFEKLAEAVQSAEGCGGQVFYTGDGDVMLEYAQGLRR